MKYTVRFCHLNRLPQHRIDHTIKRGDIVGVMGNSGASKGAHLHIDCIERHIEHVYRLQDIEDGVFHAAYRQLNYFIDTELFAIEPVITSYFNDPLYMQKTGKVHCGYDLVPKNRHETNGNFIIHWNRSMDGVVLSRGHDKGYGYYINIGFEA